MPARDAQLLTSHPLSHAVITSGGILVPAIPVILGHPTDPDAAPATPRGAQRARPPGLLSMMTDAPEWQTRRAAAEACQALVIALGPAVDASVGSSVPLDDPSRPSSRVMAAARAARFDRVRDVRQAGALAALAVARLHEHMSGSAAGMQWPAFIQECLPRDYRESRGPGGSPGQSPGRGISPGNTRRPKQLNEAFLAAQQRGEEIRAPFLDKLRESLQGLDAHLDDGEGQVRTAAWWRERVVGSDTAVRDEGREWCLSNNASDTRASVALGEQTPAPECPERTANLETQALLG